MKKKPPSDPQSCASCRCFAANPGDAVGYCKRFPPVPLVIDDAIRCAYQTVSTTDICGEYAVRFHS